MEMNLYRFKQQIQENGVIYCYSGPISQKLTEATGSTIRAQAELQQETPNNTMKLFSVFIEMVQNISQYSVTEHKEDSEEANKEGIIVIGKENQRFYIHCGNLIKMEDSKRLDKRLSFLQQMDKADLRSFYKEQRRKEPDKYSKGAGLGFIEIARKSTLFEYDIKDIDRNHAFFTLRATF